MLVECGFVRATTSDGAEFTFTPSFARIAGLGSPQEIVKIYAGLHGPGAAREAAFVLAGLCDRDDALALTGWLDGETRYSGLMPEAEQIIIARHLMEHGIIGKARPGAGDGKYSDGFNAAEYIAAACVHLGLSRADAEALSMTEFQTMFKMKFPEAREKEVMSREEYRAAMARIKAKA